MQLQIANTNINGLEKSEQKETVYQVVQLYK